jgi:hypothetical protein
VLGEISLFLTAIDVKRKAEFNQLLASTTFPSMGLSVEKAQEFIAALNAAPDGKIFKKVCAGFEVLFIELTGCLVLCSKACPLFHFPGANLWDQPTMQNLKRETSNAAVRK